MTLVLCNVVPKEMPSALLHPNNHMLYVHYGNVIDSKTMWYAILKFIENEKKQKSKNFCCHDTSMVDTATCKSVVIPQDVFFKVASLNDCTISYQSQ
jgi:hypothetical protein